MEIRPVPWPRPAAEVDPAPLPALKAEVERLAASPTGAMSVAVGEHAYRYLSRAPAALRGPFLTLDRMRDHEVDMVVLGLRCAALGGHVRPELPEYAFGYLAEARRQRQRDLLGLPIQPMPTRRSLVEAGGWLTRGGRP